MSVHLQMHSHKKARLPPLHTHTHTHTHTIVFPPLVISRTSHLSCFTRLSLVVKLCMSILNSLYNFSNLFRLEELVLRSVKEVYVCSLLSTGHLYNNLTTGRGLGSVERLCTLLLPSWSKYCPHFHFLGAVAKTFASVLRKSILKYIFLLNRTYMRP